MNRFDEIFSRKAAEVFSRYNADHLANAGWNSFMKKYKRKPRSGFVIPLWAKVASVAILLISGTVFTYKTFNRKTNADIVEVKKTMHAGEPKPLITEKAVIDENGVPKFAKSSKGDSFKTGIPVIYTDKKNPEPEALKIRGSGASDVLKIPAMVHTRDLTGDLFENRLELIAQEHLKQEQVALVEPDDLSHYSGKTIYMAGISGMKASVEDLTSGAQGVSIGFYIEHDLTRRISVRPGLAIARHTYDLKNTTDTKALSYTAPALNSLSGSLDSYKARVDVISMEVPVNIVFTIWERSKSNLFVSTGVSTVIYLNQHLNGSFRNKYLNESIDMATGQVYNETNYTMVEIESEHAAFSRVDYFGLANFSAGYSLPFGKNGSILVEPFVQLPVINLTSLNLRIRYGGLSMKIQF